MSFKSKLLNIITFGYVGRKAKKEAKKALENKNSELKVNTVDLPDVKLLVDALGGKDNIVQMSTTISTITIKIAEFEKIDNDQLKKIIKKGVVKSSTNITLLVGDCAAALKTKIEEYKQEQ